MSSLRIAFVIALTIAASAIAHASQIGEIVVCYACDGDGQFSTGNATIDAALAANPGVAFDGLLFAFINTSSSAITGGVFSVSNASPADSFALPTIAANSTFVFIPGVTSDGGSHPSGGLFAATGIKDTSDGDGGVTDSSIFKFTGTDNLLGVTSTTLGSSTATPGTFTPGDPGLFKTWISPTDGMTSFIGLGPNGDPGCTDCYFGEVATLNTAAVSGVPEPTTAAFAIAGLALMSWITRRRRLA